MAVISQNICLCVSDKALCSNYDLYIKAKSGDVIVQPHWWRRLRSIHSSHSMGHYHDQQLFVLDSNWRSVLLIFNHDHDISLTLTMCFFLSSPWRQRSPNQNKLVILAHDPNHLFSKQTTLRLYLNLNTPEPLCRQISDLFSETNDAVLHISQIL